MKLMVIGMNVMHITAAPSSNTPNNLSKPKTNAITTAAARQYGDFLKSMKAYSRVWMNPVLTNAYNSAVRIGPALSLE